MRASSVNVGGAYTSLAPYRLVDTRAGSGYTGAGDTLGPGSTFTFAVTRIDTVPSSATAVALNVTVTDTTAPSYLTVYPAGSGQPLVSNLNWVKGNTTPNLVIVPVGSDGEVSAFNDLGSADLVVDLEGYFAPESLGSTNGSYGALTPARILDTRSDDETLGPGSSLNVQVTGQGGIPSTPTEVEAALLNVTVTDTTAPSYLTVYPAEGSQPTASNLNWTGGQTVANRVVVPVNPATGKITVYNDFGRTDVVIDVDGYFSEAVAPTNASLYTAVTPVRAIDTRSGSGEPGAGETLGPRGALSDKLSQIGSLGSNVTAVVSNVTATDTSTPSYFTVYPGPSRPLASDLNWASGQTVANLTLATVGSDGIVNFYNADGTVDLVVDIFGYFSSTATLDEDGYQPSTNWSGYAEENGPDTSATGTFVVPSLYTGQEGTQMSEWVGLDGFGTDNLNLIQAGIDEYPDPSDSSLFYIIPWWEILPADPTEVPITTIRDMAPGDTVTVTITQVSGTNWNITLDDVTQGESFNTDQTYGGSGATAEWIVEAPTDATSGAIYPLADYSPTGFTAVSTDGADTAQVAVYMVQNGVIVSVPSSPGEGGTSFNVDYGDSVPAPP